MAVVGRTAAHERVRVSPDGASTRRDAGMCDKCGRDDGERGERREEASV